MCRLTGLWIVIGLFSSQAFAGSFYLETGVGVAQIREGTSLYGSALSSSPTPGAAFNLSLIQNLSHESDLLQVHFGIKDRYGSSAEGGASYVLQSLYPIIRLESPRLYFGGGITPFVWKNETGGTSFTKVNSAVGIFGEVGLLWRVVPFFYLALEGAGQFVSKSGSLSPRPALEATLQFRFYFESSNTDGARTRRWDGWRYPFGIAIY